MAIVDKVLSLTRQLYPRARAFKMAVGSNFEKLHKALAVSEAMVYSDSISTLDSAIPDNLNFTSSDATAWEKRLGLISNPLVPLADRKLAIIRKMNHPGTIKARQHYLYLQGQLQAAGFDVYIYENRFPDGMGGYVTQDPLVFSGGFGGDSNQLGDFQLGDAQLGSGFGDKVVNSIDPAIDGIFNLGTNLKSTFFVGGSTPGVFANVDIERKTELRQLILKIKPTQTVGFLLVNYI